MPKPSLAKQAAQLERKFLSAMRKQNNPARAAHDAQYHKVARTYLGVPTTAIDTTLASLGTLDDDLRVALAQKLWRHNVHEARTAAPRLLKRKRLACETAAWQLIKTWVPDFDGWAVADGVAAAGALRLAAHPARLQELAAWTRAESFWVRRAALIFTLPWARRHPPSGLIDRELILNWAAGYVTDREWFIQKAIAWWLRELSKHDSARVREFLGRHATKMKPFAVREASRLLH